MKYLIVFFIVLAMPYSVLSQSILGGYNSTASGHSISIDYNINRNKLEFGVGLGINLPTEYLDQGINLFYKKKLYPVKTHEYFAFKTYINRNILEKTNFNVFVYYDFQLRRSGARSQLYLSLGYDSTLVKDRPEDGIIYQESIVEYGPYFWLENTVGVGMDIFLSKRCFLRQKVGLGITMIYGYDEGNQIVNFSGRSSMYGFLAYFGVGYRLK